MSDIGDYVVDVEQFATIAQLKAVIGEANDLMQKAVKFVNEHKERGTFSKHSLIQPASFSCSQGQYSEKVFAAFSPSSKEELEGLYGSFSRFKEKFDRGMAVQATIGINSIDSQVRILESQLRALGECLNSLETFIDTVFFSSRQRG